MHKPSDVLEIRESILYNKNVKDDIKIASVGDIHISKLVGEKDISNIYNSLLDENPDYICILGDVVDSPKEYINDKSVKDLKLLMKLCSSIAPTLVILGGHDFIYEDHKEFPELFDEIGVWREIDNMPNVYVLNDRTYIDERIVFGGYRQKRLAYDHISKSRIEDCQSFYNDFQSYPYLYEKLPNDLPKVLLTHSPEPIRDKNVEKLLSSYDVILTGHYHNGCVPSFLENIYPKGAGIVTPKLSFFPKNARGIFKLDSGTYLVYSGGWIKMSNSAPRLLHPLDMLCNRQMDVTTLTSNKEYIDEKISRKKLLLKK